MKPKEWRDKMGLTQDKMAKLLLITQSHISEIENNVKSASLNEVKKYHKKSKGLVSLEDFL